MPIRFRCAYCRQLMGIARRKAGTVVKCPTCGGQVIVPKPEPAQPASRPAQVFEQSDFGAVLEQPALPPASLPPGTPAGDALVGQDAMYDVEAFTETDLPSAGLQGVFLTTGRMVLLVIIVLLLLALAFCSGIFLGRATVLQATPAEARVTQ